MELFFTFRNEDKASLMTRLHTYLTENNFIPRDTDRKCFWKKITDVEKNFVQLKKSHNARCFREGSHQVDKLISFLDRPFYKSSVKKGINKSANQQSLPFPPVTPDCDRNSTADNLLMYTGCDSCDPISENRNELYTCTPAKLTDAGTQVCSPQIRTEGQSRRTERKARRQLAFQSTIVEKLEQKVEKKDEQLMLSEQKRKQAMRALKEKKDKMVELNNRCKQLAMDVKKTNMLEKEKARSDQALEKFQSVITELTDENIELENSIDTLSDTLTNQKKKTRRLQQKVSKLKTNKQRVEMSVKQLCLKIETGQGVEQCVGEICDEVCTLGGDKKLIESLALAMKSTVTVKHKNAYSDNVSLLMMELQNLGVTQSAVGQVANICLKHLCGRELDHIVSRRTAG